MKKFAKILLILLLISQFKTYSDEDSFGNSKFGIFGSYNLHHYLANFGKLPNVPSCCPSFGNGDGTGFNLGLLYEIPLPYSIQIGLRSGFSFYKASFSSLEGTLVRVDSQIQNGTFKHLLNTRMTDYFFEPYIIYNPFLNLNLIFGGHLGYFVSSKYDQKEMIVEPVDRGVFVDTRTRTRNESSGDITETNGINGALLMGLSYHFPLNRRGSLILAPEFIFSQGLTDLLKNINWKANSFKFGLAIKYTYIEKEPQRVPKFLRKKINKIIDTLYVESDLINKRTFKVGIPQLFSEDLVVFDTTFNIETQKRTDTIFIRPEPIAKITINTNKINLQSQFITEGYPILPVVFFDYMNSEITSFYEKPQNINLFNVEKLEMNPIVFHRNVLNIIGQRLNKDKSQTIVLQGYADSIMEKGDCNLALRRAEAVKSYLVNVWNIEPQRIKTKTRNRFCSPPQHTFTQNDSGYAENRRVEITSPDNQLLSSVLRKRTLQLLNINPTVIKFDPQGTTPNGVKEWYLDVSQDGKQILSSRGVGSPNIVTDTIYPEVAREFSINDIDVEFGIIDSEGKLGLTKSKIKINKDTLENEIQRISLILFAVNSDKVPEGAKEDLKSFIQGMDGSSKIKISGYSDILGNYDDNQSLSKRRAQNTADLIKSISPDIEIESIEGFGSYKFPPGLKSYSSAVERFLSRTVQVEIIKKRQK